MEIILDETNGDERVLVSRTENHMLYVMEITELDSGKVIRRKKWKGESAWSDAQREVGDITGNFVYFG